MSDITVDRVLEDGAFCLCHHARAEHSVPYDLAAQWRAWLDMALNRDMVDGPCLVCPCNEYRDDGGPAPGSGASAAPAVTAARRRGAGTAFNRLLPEFQGAILMIRAWVADQ